MLSVHVEYSISTMNYYNLICNKKVVTTCYKLLLKHAHSTGLLIVVFNRITFRK